MRRTRQEALLALEADAAGRGDYAEATRLAEERIWLFGIYEDGVRRVPRGRAAMTDAQIREIRASEEDAFALADRHDTSESAVRAIKRGESYAWVR